MNLHPISHMKISVIFLLFRSGGGSLIYTSTKENFNTSLLYKYLLHRLYNFPLRDSAQVVEKDAIFM